MPELAEVAYSCSRWKNGLGNFIIDVTPHPTTRVYRENNRTEFIKCLTGAKLESSSTHGKQMLFSFSDNKWLGIHLGMTGSLNLEPSDYLPTRHDALLLRQSRQTLAFRDPRQFGRLRLHLGKSPPEWWSKLPTSMLHKDFKLKILSNALNRHSRRPIKALLLDQRYFPGMGNWMADEVLWRSSLHPATLGAHIKQSATENLFKQILFVVRGAMKSVGKHGGDPPRNWLFHARWKDGLLCPKTKSPLIREQIGGRTTCWCPVLQQKV